jgi:hypothetical protein
MNFPSNSLGGDRGLIFQAIQIQGLGAARFGVHSDQAGEEVLIKVHQSTAILFRGSRREGDQDFVQCCLGVLFDTSLDG